jgi:hypothetical protein
MDALQRHAWYKDTVRKADRSRGASATVPEAAKVVQGAAEFVYGKGNSKKGHLPGVQVVCVCVCVCVCMCVCVVRGIASLGTFLACR